MKFLKLAFFTLFLFATSTISYPQQASVVSSSNSDLKTVMIDLGDEQYASTSLDDVLAKYKGKVIYLDFWASWCNPCRKEMPYSLDLQKKYQGKDVVFIYMSTDKNSLDWKNMVAQLKLTGMNYRASDAVKQQIVNQFNLQFIPRYVLINKSGKVVDGNAKRPSDPAAVADINKLL